MNRAIYLLILTTIYLQSVSEVFAQNSGGGTTIRIVQPSGAGIQVGNRDSGTLVSTLITNVINIIFIISAIGIIIMILWGAFEWITSGGNKDKIQAAQKRITAALIGAAVLALAFVVMQVVGQILNLNILGPYTIPTLL